MKKIALFILTVSVLFLFSCKSTVNYDNFIENLKYNELYGETQNLKIKAFSGKKNDYDYNGDNSLLPYLTFYLLEKENDTVDYYITVNVNNVVYKEKFTLSPISNTLFATFYVNYTLNDISATVSFGDKNETVILSSLITEKVISYKTALDNVFTQLPSLTNKFYDEKGSFNGKIICKISVKNDRYFWYVSLSKDNYKKALLVDAKTGELLAMRDIL